MLTAVVVLPTPPFWLATAMTRVGTRRFNGTECVTSRNQVAADSVNRILGHKMIDSELLVIGHRNPDTDAICSAIGYAEFKRRTGSPHAQAARCGDTNDRIDFVLETFGVPAPRFVSDVSPKVRDVMVSSLISVPPTDTVARALGVMDEK